MRLHALRSPNQPSPRLPTASRTQWRQPLISDRVYCGRSATTVLGDNYCCDCGVAFVVVAGRRRQGRADVQPVAASSFWDGYLAAYV